MSDFEINYDTRPYLPDIFIKENIYNSWDIVNNNNTIGINSTIFIFNINRPLTSIYNDPGYLLYGIKKFPENYEFPSLNFFYIKNTNLNLDFNTTYYKSSIPQYNINNNIKYLLELIGYNINNININEFQYQELLVTETINSNKTNIIYMYFNLINNNIETNYNNYSSTIYYNNKYWNILIYPYIETTNIPYLSLEYFYNYSLIVNTNTNTNNINTIDFDDRENIKYYEKIDYKYFENYKFTMNNNTDLETLKNYSFNIKNYCDYIKNEKNKIVININLNEISKLYYETTDNNYKNSNTYTNIYLNNKHINNYKSYSQDNNKYSYSFDNKIGNLNLQNLINNKYSCYNYDSINNQTTYQYVKNYYLNTYYSITNIQNENSILTINYYLHKIFLIINPKIIDKNYLLNNIKTNISSLFIDSNKFEFGNSNDKLKLFLIGNIKSTNIYYINKFKIIFEFTDENIIYSYIINLGVVFYNNIKINILNTNITLNMNDLAYTNYTIIEPTISLCPTINNFKNIAKIYEELINYDIKNITKYSFTLDYKFLSLYENESNIIKFINFYNLIPNIITELKTIYDVNYKNFMNVLMLKVNNYIKNFININNNFENFNNKNKIKNYIKNCILYDENIIKTNDEINPNIPNYIEYYEYFPKISLEYLTIDKNYSGKYKKIVTIPYNNININSFGIIPAGKYIKFNFINYNAIYPEIINEKFIKSIKTIEDIINYNYSLFIMLPYNINLDDNFYYSNPEYFWTSEYSMNIGNNNTYTYLVLTNEYGIPYEFYKDESNIKNKGLIYGIQIFNYYNYKSENLNLKIIQNLFFNKYINFTQLIILTETYKDYTDSNNVLWDINNSFLKLHNLNCLKEIVNYDFKRFNNNYNKKNIQIEYENFNYKFLEILYGNKFELNKIRTNTKILIFVSNLFKIIKLLEKCINYCEIIKVNIMIEKEKDKNQNQMLCSIIKYNIGIISDLLNINYNLNITSGTFDTDVYLKISEIYLININNSLENINNYEIYCVFIINYSKNKLTGILELINLSVKDKKNIYINLYNEIYYLICWEEINFWIGEEVYYNIEQLIANTSITIFDEFKFLTIEKKNLLLKQIGSFIKIILLNLTKIDELFNLAKLMGDSLINDYIPENLKVVKDNYIYNTFSYTKNTNIPKFNIINFLNDTYNLIIKQSNDTTSLFYKNYKKSIEEGILIYITNTINYFKQIINQIIYIYKYEKNILDINNINIYDPEKIGNFYYILTEFYNNSSLFFEILYTNKINLFYEYDNLKISLDNLFYSCEEYLLYVRLWNDFMNNNIIMNVNIYVNEDLYKIIKSDTFYDFTIKTIKTFYNLLIIQEPQLVLLYLENIKVNFIDKKNLPLKFYLIQVINIMITELKNEINTEIKNNYIIIMYGSYYILPYQDLLLYKNTFNWASFNFYNNVIELINTIDKLNSIIFNTYYTDSKVTIFYTQTLNYTYLTTPYKYININNYLINT